MRQLKADCLTFLNYFLSEVESTGLLCCEKMLQKRMKIKKKKGKMHH